MEGESGKGKIEEGKCDRQDEEEEEKEGVLPRIGRNGE